MQVSSLGLLYYTTTFIAMVTDKSPQLMEFLQQVKSNAETAALFESVQNDTHSTGGAEPMDL